MKIERNDKYVFYAHCKDVIHKDNINIKYDSTLKNHYITIGNSINKINISMDDFQELIQRLINIDKK